MSNHNPKVFVNYSHEEPQHNQWVVGLATDLRKNGVDTSVDEWDLTGGQDMAFFMESRIRDSDFVVLVCTPLYAEKSNIPRGGVGYEKNIISAEMLQTKDLRPKFIPILRKGTPEDALPTYLGSKFAIDFRESRNYKEALDELLRTIYEQPHPDKPPLGPRPFEKKIEVYGEKETGRKRSKFEQDINGWEKEALGRFEFLRNDRLDVQKGDPFQLGYWQASFVLNEEIPRLTLVDFLEVLRRSVTGRTGWDIGWVPTRTGIEPYPYKEGIEVWLAEDGTKGSGHSDFWRAEPRGRFSLFRGYQEDEKEFSVGQPGKILDFSLVLWRISEILLYIESLAKHLKTQNAESILKITWNGLKGRRIGYHKGINRIYERYICNEERISFTHRIPICSRIKETLIGDVHKITQPLFESFNFFSLKPEQTKKHIKELFDSDKELQK